MMPFISAVAAVSAIAGFVLAFGAGGFLFGPLIILVSIAAGYFIEVSLRD